MYYIYNVGEILTVHESPTLEVQIVWADSSHGVWMCCGKKEDLTAAGRPETQHPCLRTF